MRYSDGDIVSQVRQANRKASSGLDIVKLMRARDLVKDLSDILQGHALPKEVHGPLKNAVDNAPTDRELAKVSEFVASVSHLEFQVSKHLAR